MIDKVPKALDEMMPQRATTEQTWDFVIETLKDAISLLKGHNSDPTRATEWAAKGLLAKVYMQARRPVEAKPILEDIINNSGKKLVPIPFIRICFMQMKRMSLTKNHCMRSI